MRVAITFPDGKMYIYSIDVSDCKSIDDIVEKVIDEMYKQQKDRIKKPEKWRLGVKKWLLPYLTSVLLEKRYR
jgi:hypothetical protein